MINQCFSGDSCEEILSSLERLAVQTNMSRHYGIVAALMCSILLRANTMVCLSAPNGVVVSMDWNTMPRAPIQAATSLYKSNGLNVIGEHIDLMA
nr:3-hydroxyisobutyryl-CoA hydrolase 1-like [Tanacetum cinerariifolium]